MKPSEDIRALTDLRAHAVEFVRGVVRSRRALVLTERGRARAVLLDVASYEALRDAAAMRALLAPGEADIVAGRTVPLATAAARLRKRRHAKS